MTRKIDPCRYCGATTKDCLPGCQCAKCIDPKSYADWKKNKPEQYQKWLDSQVKMIKCDLCGEVIYERPTKKSVFCGCELES